MSRRAGGVWQRSFYDRVIRDGGELDLLAGYLRDNPARWAEDRLREGDIS